MDEMGVTALRAPAPPPHRHPAPVILPSSLSRALEEAPLKIELREPIKKVVRRWCLSSFFRMFSLPHQPWQRPRHTAPLVGCWPCLCCGRQPCAGCQGLGWSTNSPLPSQGDQEPRAQPQAPSQVPFKPGPEHMDPNQLKPPTLPSANTLSASAGRACRQA